MSSYDNRHVYWQKSTGVPPTEVTPYSYYHDLWSRIYDTFIGMDVVTSNVLL